MGKDITENDIDESVKSKIYVQDYSPKTIIEGVVLLPLKNYVGEDGDLSEVLKTTENGEVEGLNGFKIAQVNRTKVYPGTIKGWHLHFKQNDVWFVLPSSHLLVGLWDMRKSSSTKGSKMRLAMGGGNSQLLFIPNGVAHGMANISQKDAEIFYFVDKKFNRESPDEKRIPWDILGKDFWKAQKD